MALGVAGSNPVIHPIFLFVGLDLRQELISLGCRQVGKAPDFDSGIRRFESCHPSQCDPLAQSAEHLPFKQGVRSSNLRWVTKKKDIPFGISFFFIIHLI